jgi:hypothetical protein
MMLPFLFFFSQETDFYIHEFGFKLPRIFVGKSNIRENKVQKMEPWVRIQKPVVTYDLVRLIMSFLKWAYNIWEQKPIKIIF